MRKLQAYLGDIVGLLKNINNNNKKEHINKANIAIKSVR